MYSLSAIDQSVLTSYHMGLYVVIIIGLMIALATVLKYNRAQYSDDHFSYILKEDSRPQTTQMHRISSDLCRFWRTQVKNKNVDYTVFCHKNVPKGLLIEPLPVYEIVNSLIGRAFYKTEKGRIHVHITYTAQTSRSGVLNIIVANTGNGDLSPIYIGQSEQHEIFDLDNLEQNIKRTNGYYSYKTAAGRGTEFSVSIPSEIHVPHQDHSETISEPRTAGLSAGASKIESDASKRTLQDMGQTDTSTMKLIVDFEDDDLTLPEPASQDREVSPTETQDLLDLALNIDDQIIADSTQLYNISNGSIIDTQSLIDSPTLKKLSALIIEVQSSHRAALQALLEPLDHNSIYTDNTEQAVDAFKVNQFDYMIIDIDGPKMTKDHLLQFMRETAQADGPIPTIAITTDTSSQTAHNALSTGIDMVLTKPTTATHLYEAIQLIIENQSGNQKLPNFAAKSISA